MLKLTDQYLFLSKEIELSDISVAQATRDIPNPCSSGHARLQDLGNMFVASYWCRPCISFVLTIICNLDDIKGSKCMSARRANDKFGLTLTYILLTPESGTYLGTHSPSFWILVPDNWRDTQAAALGGVGWSTVCLAKSDPDALALEGRSGDPITMTKNPVSIVVYGGATATGLIAIQILRF